MKATKQQLSARDCRFRKKLRYEYLHEVVSSAERSVIILRAELDQLKEICMLLDRSLPLSQQQDDFIVQLNRKLS